MVVAIVVVVVIVTIMVVAIAVMVPAMVMLDMSMRTVPIAHEVVPTFPAGTYPMSFSIGRTRPVAFVPDVAPAYGIPIAVDPEVPGSRATRVNSNYAGRRWCSNRNAHRHLGIHS
jgi:hypothetical protein